MVDADEERIGNLENDSGAASIRLHGLRITNTVAARCRSQNTIILSAPYYCIIRVLTHNTSSSGQAVPAQDSSAA